MPPWPITPRMRYGPICAGVSVGAGIRGGVVENGWRESGAQYSCAGRLSRVRVPRDNPCVKRSFHLLSARARWTDAGARLYDLFVARGQERLYDALAAEVLAYAPAAGELLDVGCGPGHAAVALVRARPALHVFGVDASAEMVR